MEGLGVLCCVVLSCGVLLGQCPACCVTALTLHGIGGGRGGLACMMDGPLTPSH